MEALGNGVGGDGVDFDGFGGGGRDQAAWDEAE